MDTFLRLARLIESGMSLPLALRAISRLGLSDDLVTTDSIKDDAVTTAKIQDGAVTEAKILNDAVTTDKILDSNVTSAKLASDQYGGDYIKLSDVKADTTDGGTFTSGAWQTKDLNTEDHDTGNNCSLSSNQFTLDAGTYRVRAFSPCFAVNRNKARLYNISDSTTEILGQNSYALNTSPGYVTSNIVGEITISAAKIFEIQHRCETTGTTDGFGTDTSFGVDEVYTVVELWKVK